MRSLFFSGLLLLGVVLVASAAAAEDGPARFVIAVGYNAGPPDPRPTLSYADDDAARFFQQQLPSADKAWLLTTFDNDSARSFPDLAVVARPPTRLELARVLGELAWQVRDRAASGRATELVFYFAGHGSVSPGGEGFLVLPDGPFTRTELQQQVVQGSPTDVNHIILDACASYFMVTPRGEADEPSADAESGGVALTPEALDVMRAGDGFEPASWARTGVLVSTSGSAAVHETPALGSGVFSYLLRSALAGAGDANGDGRIEYAEAAGFIAAGSSGLLDERTRLKVHARHPQQRPNAPLNDLTTGSVEHFLELPGDGAARVRLLDANGVPYAEVNREAGRPTLIALVGHPFYVVQVAEKEALLVPRAPGAYALSALQFSPKGKARAADVLSSSLFATPYGHAYLSGFVAHAALLSPAAGAAPFVVAHAAGGAPPVPWPLRPAAVGSFVVAGALGAAATGMAVGNLLAFAELERSVEETGALDADKSLEAEAWRAGASLAGAAAIIAALGGGALWLLAGVDEEEAPWN